MPSPTMVSRGEIYWVEFDPVRGSEQGGLRPALIVQQDIGNRYSPTTVVAAITRTLPPRPYPFIVTISPDESGLPDESAINCAQLATIQVSGPASRLRAPSGQNDVRPIGRLNARKLSEVDEALKYNLGLR
ncbi:MAG TPA: type II toxin-antitoxin system PemK/MazF family toxin [Chloroflexota bacterium]|nr:type II toxin-antitoxin system PemK/MazF family toxin [Chloroflexota bacterium]